MKEFKAKITWMSPNSITPYATNSKKHPKKQIEALARHIAKNGWDVPVVIDEERIILKGHGRRLAALALGLDKIPVIMRTGLTKGQKKAIRIADNKLAESEWDKDFLKIEFKSMSSEEISDSGFDNEELKEFDVEIDLGESDEDYVANTEETTEQIPTENPNENVKTFGDTKEDAKIVGKRFVIIIDCPSQEIKDAMKDKLRPEIEQAECKIY